MTSGLVKTVAEALISKLDHLKLFVGLLPISRASLLIVLTNLTAAFIYFFKIRLYLDILHLEFYFDFE